MQPNHEDTIVWGCRVEWVEEMEVPRGEFEVHCEAKSKYRNEKKSLPPEGSPKMIPCEDCIEPTECRLAEEHLKLIFEVRGEVDVLKFKVEQLDAKLSLPLVRQSISVDGLMLPSLGSSACSESGSPGRIPDTTILLPESRSISPRGALVISQFLLLELFVNKYFYKQKLMYFRAAKVP